MLNEFEFIAGLRSKYNLTKIGDDCAVLPKDSEKDLLLTADMLIEDIDFRLEWAKPAQMGWKALAVSLSDIAAMGGVPKWAMLSLGVPERLWNTAFLDNFYEGWHELAGQFGVELIGGDVSRAPDHFVIDSIVGGEVSKGKAILRSGAEPGDIIFVTGFLGGARAGLSLLENKGEINVTSSIPINHLMRRQLQPIPHIVSANILQEYGLPTAMIDISDGFSSDLLHLVDASKVGATIYSDQIPIDPTISALARSEEFALNAALNGGEDFELLFTTSPANVPTASDLGFHRVGEITSNTGVVELVTNGNAVPLEPRGFRHF